MLSKPLKRSTLLPSLDLNPTAVHHHPARLQLMRDIVAEGPQSERVAMTMTYTLKAAGDLGTITQVGRGGALGLGD